MNLQSGILIGVPIPESDGLSSGETIQQAIESALLQAKYVLCRNCTPLVKFNS